MICTLFKRKGLAVEDHVVDSVGKQMTDQAVGLVDRVKVWFNGLGILQRLQDHKQLLIDAGIYLGIGFVIGLVIKRYLKYILLVVLFMVALTILEQFNIINIGINWPKIQELFNIQHTVSFDDAVLSTYKAWLQDNVWMVLSASLGFLAGLKVG